LNRRSVFKLIVIVIIISSVTSFASVSVSPGLDSKLKQNAEMANSGFRHCQRYLNGWLKIADPETGLIPKNLRKSHYWNAQDSAADNYAFMVLTSSFVDRDLFKGKMRQMLETEIRLTSRLGVLPDTYDFKTQRFLSDKPNINSIMFGSSEYVKDGLLPLTEWLGPSPWSERMISILDEMWKRAPIDTPYGRIVSENVEVGGEMLQTLSRIYWMTGDKKYLNWARRLGDYYLLGGHHPTDDSSSLRLRDHGNEIISGLCELYATMSYADPGKAAEYRPHIHRMLDRVLEIGRNHHGFFFNRVNPQTDEVVSKATGFDLRLSDCFGYVLNGYYTVYLLDGNKSYKDAVLKVMENLNPYYMGDDFGETMDGRADAVEGALNLYSHQPVDSAVEWIDSTIRDMWAIQKDSGIIQGWHGDGNFARTTIMYNLWKTQGISIRPWRDDVYYGAVRDGDAVILYIRAEKNWKGRIIFDSPRHKTIMHLPLDWPRINQFPEWFTVEADSRYVVRNIGSGLSTKHDGKELLRGLSIELKAGQELRLVVEPN
jgi:hypothetical protein